jgi:hypothetical protein
LRPKPGDRVRFSVDVERIHFFDPDTGLSIVNRRDPAAVPAAADSTAAAR